MKKPTDLGANRTGVGISPIDGQSMQDGAQAAEVTGDANDPNEAPDPIAPIGQLRAEYAEEAPPVGTLPPPATRRGVAEGAVDAFDGSKAAPTILVDKLGERLASQRTGARLYEVLIDKLGAITDDVSASTGPTLVDLRQLKEDELRHIELLKGALEELGADPTAITPSADLAGVATSGVLQVLTDPRARLPECLQALLVAELTDTDGWQLLVELCESLGKDSLALRCREASTETQDHLHLVRTWLSEHTLAGADGQVRRFHPTASVLPT
jgi:hypothetical protein